MELVNSEGTLHRSIEGGKWMFMNIFIQRAISIGTFFILARLLSPADFGIIAIILLLPPILDLLLTIDFDTALIQSQENPYPYLNVLWTINIIRSSFIFLIIFFIGPKIAQFFSMSYATNAIRLGGIFILIQGFGNTAQLVLFKTLDFKKLFIRDIVSRSSYVITAIFLAWYSHSYWALFWANMASYISALVIVYIIIPYRPSFSLKFTLLKNLLEYGKWLYGQNVLGEFVGTVENSVIGKLLGASEIGLYGRAKALAQLPTSPILSLINKVSFPAYSRLHGSKDKMLDGFGKSVDIVATIAMPFLILLMVSGVRLVRIGLGAQWIGMTNLLPLLVAGTTLSLIPALMAPILNASGNPNLQLKISVATSMLNIILIALGTYVAGVWGTAAGFFISMIVGVILTIKYSQPIIGLPLLKFIKLFTIPTIAGSVFLLSAQNMIYLGDMAFLGFLMIIGFLYLGILYLLGTRLNIGPYQTFKTVAQELKIPYLAMLLS